MVGYEFLLSKIPLRTPELSKPARIKPVTRVEEVADLIAIPKTIAPIAETILPHLLFALKHEPIQLARVLEGTTPQERLLFGVRHGLYGFPPRSCAPSRRRVSVACVLSRSARGMAFSPRRLRRSKPGSSKNVT